MEKNELRKLKRSDLLEIMIRQGEQIESLEQQLSKAKEELENRYLTLENAGSIAEAVLRLNGVYEAAEAAAQQYFDNIERLNQEQVEILAKREESCKEQVAQILAKAKYESEQIVEKAKRESEQFWISARDKVDRLKESDGEAVREDMAEGENEAATGDEGDS